jgi:hypothetical protein
MDMTQKERLLWLNQINRIHREQKVLREKETMEQAERLFTARTEQQEKQNNSGGIL